MAKQVKSFWLKLTTVFLTIYFSPIGHVIMALFGGRAHSGHAYAGIITCSGRGSDSIECEGTSGTFSAGSRVQCICKADPSKVYDVVCQSLFAGDGEQEVVDNAWSVPTGCYYPDACSPNGKTKDCSTSKQYCTKTCTNGRWGPSVWGNCKSGYIKIGDVCEKECSIANGKGYEYDEPSSSSSSSSVEI